EWVFLLGGLDQNVAIPSLSWMVGLRTKEGAEFGVGPNVTPAGVALALAAGVTMRAGVLNVPMNFAVVPTRAGTRVTMLTGFTMRRGATGAASMNNRRGREGTAWDRRSPRPRGSSRKRARAGGRSV